MATADAKRTASIYINDADAQRALKRLQEEARHLVKRLEEVPLGSKDFKDISARLTSVQRNMKALGSEVREQDGWFKKMQGSIGPIGPMLLGAFGASAIKAGISASIIEFKNHEAAIDKVSVALRNNEGASKQTMAQLTSSADAMELDSLYSAEEILSSVSTQLLNFGTIAGDNFTRAQQVAVDLSSTLGGDLQGTTLALGKALANPAEGLSKLSRMGVVFTEQQKDQVKAMSDAGQVAEAQALILGELESRYAGQAAASAKHEQGLRALDQAMGDLVEGAGGLFNGMLNSLAGGLATMVSGLSEWLGLTHKQSDAMAEQRVEMNALFNTLRAGNITEQQRAELVARINKEYGEFLPRTIAITDSEGELAAAQRVTNQAMKERILLLAKQELMQEAQDEAVAAQKGALEAELDMQRARQTGGTVMENLRAKALGVGDAYTYYAMVLRKQKKEVVEADKALADLAERLGDVNAAMAGAGGTTEVAQLEVGVEDPEAVSKKTEEVRKVLADARARLALDSVQGKERELAELADKYWKMAQQAEGSGVGLEEIENLHAEERANVRRKWAAKELEELRKLDEQIAAMRLEAAAKNADDGGAEVAAIRARYAARFEEIKGNAEQEAELQLAMDAELAAARAEGIAAHREAELALELGRVESKYAKLEESAKGHTARLAALEEMKQAELTALRQQHSEQDQERREELLSVEEEERLASIERKLVAMDEEYALAVAKREEQELGFEDLRLAHEERRNELEAELLEAKKELVNTHYEELYAQFDEQNLSTQNLQRLHGEAMAAIDAEAARNQIRKTREKNAEIIQSEKDRNLAMKQVGFDMLDAMDAMFAASAGSAKEAQDFHKAITLVKIGVDTASAISSIIAASAIGDPFTAAIRMAAGVAVVITNIAKATALLNREAPEPPAFAEGGGTERALPRISQGGAVNTPTLGLFGEEGPEWVAPNRMYKHPELAPVFHWLEDIRVTGRMRKFALGGATYEQEEAGVMGSGPVKGTAVVNAAGPAGGGSDGMAPLLMQVNSTLEQLNAQLSTGIRASLNYDQQQEDEERMATIKNDANRSR